MAGAVIGCLLFSQHDGVLCTLPDISAVLLVNFLGITAQQNTHWHVQNMSVRKLQFAFLNIPGSAILHLLHTRYKPIIRAESPTDCIKLQCQLLLRSLLSLLQQKNQKDSYRGN